MTTANQTGEMVMRVDFSEWNVDRANLVARKYTYSQMRDARDCDLEVHFDIQAGMSIFTFVTFLISELDLPQEAPVRVTLRRMDGNSPRVSMAMIGRPDGHSGAVVGVANPNDVRDCVALFLHGKDLHFELDSSDGEMLARLPLPNDETFGPAYNKILASVKEVDDAGLIEANPERTSGTRSIEDFGILDRAKNHIPTWVKFGEVPKFEAEDIRDFESGLLNPVREQLASVGETFFGSGKPWPRISFPEFIRFPVFAGYTLGILDGFIGFRNIQLSDCDLLLSVMRIHQSLRINQTDVEILSGYLGQSPAFKFGLAVGIADVTGRNHSSGPWTYTLLSAMSELLLSCDEPDQLKRAIEGFCASRRLNFKDGSLDNIVKHWTSHKRTSLKSAALNKVNPADFEEASRWSEIWASSGDSLVCHFLGRKYESGDWFEVDPIEALKWYQVAAADTAHEFARIFVRDRDRLSTELNPIDRAEAERRARRVLD
jgi:hypothetical protein